MKQKIKDRIDKLVKCQELELDVADLFKAEIDAIPEESFDHVYYWEHLSEEDKYKVMDKKDIEITIRMIEEYVEETLGDAEEGCPVAHEFRAIFGGCIDWLKQKE